MASRSSRPSWRVQRLHQLFLDLSRPQLLAAGVEPEAQDTIVESHPGAIAGKLGGCGTTRGRRGGTGFRRLGLVMRSSFNPLAGSWISAFLGRWSPPHRQWGTIHGTGRELSSDACCCRQGAAGLLVRESSERPCGKMMPAKPDVGSPPSLHRPTIDRGGIVLHVLLPLAGVLVALVIGAIMLVILKADPIAAYGALINGAAGSVSGITQSLVKATPLLLVGLGICIAFRANVINIGGEGQIILGAILATWFPLTFHTWPGWLLIPATLIVGFLAGAAWGFVPGILKARLQVNEILSTIMMNSIAQQLMYLLIRGPLMDPAGVAAGTFLAQSARLPQQVWLPRLIPQTLLHAGAILAVLLAVGGVFLLVAYHHRLSDSSRRIEPRRLTLCRDQCSVLPGAFDDPGRRICRPGRRD